MTLTLVILAMAIPCLCLVYETRSGQRAIEIERIRASQESERTSSASREQLAMAMQILSASQTQAREFAAAIQAVQVGNQEAMQAMMAAMTSTVSAIVSPPPQPLSPEQEAFQRAMTAEPWDLMTTHPSEERERRERANGGVAAPGWTAGRVDPFSEGSLPDDVPGPIGESAQMPGVVGIDL